MSESYIGSFQWRPGTSTLTTYMSNLVGSSAAGDYIKVLSLTATNIGNNKPRINMTLVGGGVSNNALVARHVELPPKSTVVLANIDSKLGWECDRYLSTQLFFDGFNQSTAAHTVGDITITLNYVMEHH